jgi:CRP-like cAMP-binding protein
MTIENDIAFLQRIPILRALGTAALRILAIGAETSHVITGEVLFESGDVADCAYIVRSGSLRLTSERPGEPDTVAEAGTLIGEPAMLAETVRTMTAIAREDTVVVQISRAMFLRMLEGYPDAAHRLRNMIAARTDAWTRDIERVRAALAAGAAKNKPN